MAALVAAVDAPVVYLEASTASAGEFAAAVNSIAPILRDDYVYPDVGEQMAAEILSRLERGEDNRSPPIRTDERQHAPSYGSDSSRRPIVHRIGAVNRLLCVARVLLRFGMNG